MISTSAQLVGIAVGLFTFLRFLPPDPILRRQYKVSINNNTVIVAEINIKMSNAKGTFPQLPFQNDDDVWL
ncbi:hypothetical protein DERP_002268 [Dermatophagoides pteronyssinus]|uniref:Uncharacterized protein n=1 Tax=Dermatophagoides pteronyssinus TaxID=6956 RepID=A0ABQ8JHA1_DERPT|nr:hypothetical protein DERP_002268 [Dermatophagoides pteronyssinus]